VAFVVVPQSLAYAQLAGMPASRGLLAAAFPPLAAAAFASSPYLQPGPTAISAMLTFGVLSALAPPGSDRYVALGLLLALLVGVVRVLVGLLRAGVVSYLLSEPLLCGFVPAAAILICASQLPIAVGVSPGDGGVLPEAAAALGHPGAWSPTAIGFALLVSGLVLASRRVHPLLPGVLLAVVAATVLSAVAGYGGPRVGELGAIRPELVLSFPWGDAPQLLAGAVVIALLGFSEAASIARTYAAVDRQRWDADREFVAQGAANIAAGLTGGFPVGASFSRSALNRLAGARTSASGFATGVAVLLFLPFGFLLEPLPRSVLAATVVVAVVPLVRLDRIVRIVRWSRPQAAITLVAFSLTLALEPHVEWALLAAIGLSIAVHLWKELTLDVRAEQRGAVLELRPTGVLWFATARSLEDSFIDLLAGHAGTTRLEIRLDGLGRIDLTGALALRTLIGDAHAAGIEVTLAGGPPQARRILDRVLGPPDADGRRRPQASVA
jgi:SulP family sulfate permease